MWHKDKIFNRLARLLLQECERHNEDSLVINLSEDSFEFKLDTIEFELTETFDITNLDFVLNTCVHYQISGDWKQKNISEIIETTGYNVEVMVNRIFVSIKKQLNEFRYTKT